MAWGNDSVENARYGVESREGHRRRGASQNSLLVLKLHTCIELFQNRRRAIYSH